MVKHKNGHVLRKLIVLFLFIMLPLIIISSLALYESNKRLEKEILQSIFVQTQNFITVFDNDLELIGDNTALVSSHSKLLTVSYIPNLLDDYEKASAIKQFREYITNIKSVNSLISNIKVYIISVLRAFNADGYSKGSAQMITEDEYYDIVNLKTQNPGNIFYHDGRLLMLFLSSRKNPANIVEVELSIGQIKKKLNSNRKGDYYLFQDGKDFELDNIKDEEFKKVILSSNFKNGIATLQYNYSSFHAFIVPCTYMDATFIQIVADDTILEPLRLSTFFTVIFLFLIFFSIIIFFIGTTKLIHKPLTKLVNAFQEVEKNNFSVRIQETEKNEFSYLYNGYNDMSEHLSKLIDEVYSKNILLQKAEFKQLQAQINPHFLYNSFFMLQRMIKQGMQEEAVEVSKELGSYFKYITRNRSDVVDLKDEYEHAKIYSNIQALRFEGRIDIEFGEIPPLHENFIVPRLILQPIIENAFNYGLDNKVSDGLLKVQFITEDRIISNIDHEAFSILQMEDISLSKKDYIHVIIEDNGEELTDEQLTQLRNKFEETSNVITDMEITGILNIHKRIQIFYKNESRLEVNRSNLGGMRVDIYLIQNEEA